MRLRFCRCRVETGLDYAARLAAPAVGGGGYTVPSLGSHSHIARGSCQMARGHLLLAPKEKQMINTHTGAISYDGFVISWKDRFFFYSSVHICSIAIFRKMFKSSVRSDNLRMNLQSSSSMQPSCSCGKLQASFICSAPADSFDGRQLMAPVTEVPAPRLS